MNKRIVAIIFTALILLCHAPTFTFAVPITEETEPINDTIEEGSEIIISEIQENIIQLAQKQPATRKGLCAKWVINVFKKAGYSISGNACDLWRKYCDTGIENIQPGMIIAVRRSGGRLGWKYGHVGIYIGDGQVIHCSGRVYISTLEDWIKKYDKMNTVLCGFPQDVEDDIITEWMLTLKNDFALMEK